MASRGEGKWQIRILQTLAEAEVPVTSRQLRIRCGVGGGNGLAMLRQQGSFRQCLMYMTQLGLCRRIAHGIYVLPSGMSD